MILVMHQKSPGSMKVFIFFMGQLMHALFFQKMHVVAKLLCMFFFSDYVFILV